MSAISEITLNVTSEIQLKLSNGAPAGDPIGPGKYVAVANEDQQPGWFSLYAIEGGEASGDVLANVYLEFSPAGTINIGA